MPQLQRGSREMQVLMVVLRAIHIGMGVFWAGSMMFVGSWLQPSIAEAGPAGGAVMAGLMKRKVLVKIPIFAVLTMLSGLWMLWKVSNGFESQFMGSPFGIGLSIGALSAIIAFVFGMLVVRANQMKMMALMPTVNAMPDGPEKQAKMAEIGAMREKAMKGGKIVAGLLGLAVLMMGVSRYL